MAKQEQKWIEFSSYWMLAAVVYHTRLGAYKAAQRLAKSLSIPVDVMQDEAGFRLIAQYRPGSR